MLNQQNYRGTCVISLNLEEPLKLSLINSSPRIWAGQIIADFTVNREKGQFTVMCNLGRQKQKNCMQKLMENCIKHR